MKAETVHVLSLIGLRALAEFDPVEFRRSSNFSKFDIDEQIKEILSSYDMKETEAAWMYREFEKSQRIAQSQDELTFFMKRLFTMAFQEAQHFSLVFSRENKQVSLQETEDIIDNCNNKPINFLHESFLKLAVMRLLQDIKMYNPTFNYKVRNGEIDCLLEPQDEGLPFIVVEGKKAILNFKQLVGAVEQLQKHLNYWGENSLGLLITLRNKNSQQTYNLIEKNKQIYIILFDSQNNQLHGRDFERFQIDFMHICSNEGEFDNN